jgi:hypothetical protein
MIKKRRDLKRKKRVDNGLHSLVIYEITSQI